MGNIDLLNQIIIQNYGNEPFKPLFRTYQQHTKEYSEFPSLMFDALSLDKRGFSKRFINLILLLQLTKLLADKAPHTGMDALNKQMTVFVTHADIMLMDEFKDTHISISDRMDLIELLGSITRHPRCAKNGFVNKTFNALNVSLINDLSATVLLEGMRRIIDPEIEMCRNTFRDNLQSVSKPGSDPYVREWHHFHKDVLPLKFQALTAIQINELVDFMLVRRHAALAPLMQKLKAIYEVVRDNLWKTPHDALFSNAIVRVSTDAAKKMEYALMPADTEWLETARIYDTSYVYSPESIAENHRRQRNVLLSIVFLTMPAFLPPYFGSKSQNQDRNNASVAGELFCIGASTLLVGASWIYGERLDYLICGERADQMKHAMGSPKTTKNTMTLAYEATHEGSSSNNTNPSQGARLQNQGKQ